MKIGLLEKIADKFSLIFRLKFQNNNSHRNKITLKNCDDAKVVINNGMSHEEVKDLILLVMQEREKFISKQEFTILKEEQTTNMKLDTD